jgi:2-polyprenyl-6-methoxyphenol hydroxylase-like FAD-dependent oxidoreductase
MNEAPGSNATSKTLETDLLIIGAGPAGASLSCFLARYGLKGITISSASGTSPEPRAHITNSAALECLRDLDMGVYDECVRLGHSGDFIKNLRWCETMAGEEYARAPSWGMHGERRSDFETVSPCTYLDLPQSLLEPVLIKWVTAHGWLIRWDTKLMEFTEEDNGLHDKKILAKVLDQITGVEYTIRTRFLFGANGGRSIVTKQLGLPFTSMPGGALAHNVLVRAEFGHLMRYREGNLHVVPRFDKDYPFVSVARMVKPWAEWYVHATSTRHTRHCADFTLGCLCSSPRVPGLRFQSIAVKSGRLLCLI